MKNLRKKHVKCKQSKFLILLCSCTHLINVTVEVSAEARQIPLEKLRELSSSRIRIL